MSGVRLDEAGFNATSAILHDLRPRLRTVVTEAFLGHSAYADGNFPIWWQGQNNDQFIKSPRPPYYVRFSHHTSRIFQGVANGQVHIQCYAQTEPWVEALRDIVAVAYPAGERILEGILIQSVDVARAWPVKGWDNSKPWPERADFMLPVSVRWRVEAPNDGASQGPTRTKSTSLRG